MTVASVRLMLATALSILPGGVLTAQIPNPIQACRRGRRDFLRGIERICFN